MLTRVNAMNLVTSCWSKLAQIFVVKGCKDEAIRLQVEDDDFKVQQLQLLNETKPINYHVRFQASSFPIPIALNCPWKINFFNYPFSISSLLSILSITFSIHSQIFQSIFKKITIPCFLLLAIIVSFISNFQTFKNSN